MAGPIHLSLWAQSLFELVKKNRSVQSVDAGREMGRHPYGNPGRSLRVVTYNIHHGVWTNGRRSLVPVRKLVRNADVACLNEISRNQARSVAAPLGLHWASTDASESGDDPYSNNAVVSRFPIEESRAHLLPLFFMIPWRKRVLQATLNVGGRAVHVLSAHLSLLPGERAAHLRCAAEALDKLPGPRILCGDLNAPPSHPEVRELAASYQDSWAAKGQGPGLTFGTRLTLRRLDYIFASRHFDVQDVSMPDTRRPDGAFPSDHHPVAATVAVRT